MEDTNYTPVIFARSDAEAEFYKTLLEDHDITVSIGTEEDYSDQNGDDEGIPILVPKDQLDEAELIIEQRSEMDDDFEDEYDDYDDDDDLAGFGQEPVEGDMALDDTDEDEEDIF